MNHNCDNQEVKPHLRLQIKGFKDSYNDETGTGGGAPREGARFMWLSARESALLQHLQIPKTIKSLFFIQCRHFHPHIVSGWDLTLVLS